MNFEFSIFVMKKKLKDSYVQFFTAFVDGLFCLLGSKTTVYVFFSPCKFVMVKFNPLSTL